MPNLFRNALERLRADKLFAEILSGSAVALVLRLAAAFSAFFMTVVISRQLGATEAGYFLLAYTLLNVAATICRVGMDPAQVRYIASAEAQDDHATVNGVYRMAVTRILMTGLPLTLVVYLFADPIATSFFNKPDFGASLAVASLCLIPFALTWQHSFAFRGQKKVPPAVIFQSLAISLTILVLVGVSGVDLAVNAAWLMLFGISGAALVALYLWWRQPNHHWTQLPREQRLDVRAVAGRMFTIRLMTLAVQWASVVMIGIWASADNVAYFSSAQRTTILISSLLAAVNTISAPNFASLYANNDLANLEKTAKHSCQLLMSLGLPIALFLLIFADWIMGWFGEGFEQAAVCLRILTVGQFINLATGPVAYLLNMTGNEAKLRFNVMISSAIAVVGGLLIIPFFGIIGGAYVTATAIATQNLLGVWQVKKLFGFNTLLIWR